MNTQMFLPFLPLRLHLPRLAGGIAAILVSGIAIASLAISARGPGNGIDAAAPPHHAVAAPVIAAPRPSVRGYRCDECGVIESTRTIESPDEWAGLGASGRHAAGSQGRLEAPPLGNYEITVRLRDGSMRVVRDAHSARWREGERVTIIAGVNR